MASSPPPDPPQRRRPLLAGGERLTEKIERGGGGGPKTHPRSIEEAVELLAPQLEQLQEGAATTPTTLRGARVVFEATVSPNYLANSYFPKDLFAEADLIPVGTRGAMGEYRTPKKVEQRETKTYLLAGDEHSIAKVNGLLHGEMPGGAAAKRAREALRQFEVVRLPPIEETLRGTPDAIDTTVVWEAVLHPLADSRGRYSEEERSSVLAKWDALVGDLGGQVDHDYIRTIKGLTFMPVRLPADAGRQAARFNPLRAIRPMPSVRPLPVAPLRVAATNATPSEPPAAERPQSDLRVAVFDGGADDDIPHLSPFLTNTDLTDEAAHPEYLAHGTLVSATVLYGAGHDQGDLRTPEVGVDHFRVLPAPAQHSDHDLYWILDRIEEKLSDGKYPIVNLSLGPELSVDDDDEPHAWTARLDDLAERRDILFISAVGNNGELDSATGLDRVQVPADMANGIGVGACDRRPPDGAWDRAPYSAVGPGRPGARMQPLGVAFGGVDTRPFRGITAGGVIGEAIGTSFAAPTTTHGIGALAAMLGPIGKDPRVLRAFAAHCAEPASPIAPEASGFGRLAERYDDVLECKPHEATVLYCDAISRGQSIGLPFPLAEDAVTGRTIKLRWTIALSTTTDPKNPVEYTQAGLEVSFRPHANRYTFYNAETKHSKVVDIVASADEAARLMREGYVFSTLPATGNARPYRHEAHRRSEEGKWETVMRSDVNKRASSLLRPQITVSYLAREEGVLTDASPLGFAMLLTMQAPTGVALYDSVRTGFQQLVPLRTELPLRLSA
jgi:hypothetical protein